jgi:DNA-binding IclR family transcriptional regulator
LDLLTNSELAERTGLPKSTVSRLTGTLVRSGFLQHDALLGGYRLSATVLGLAHAMRSGSYILNQSLELMENVGRQMRVNIGLALPDHEDMVYLDTLRFGPKASLRKIVSGQRVPIALTSLGHAYISTQEAQAYDQLMQRLNQRHARDWRRIKPAIARSIKQLQEQGVCAVSWQPHVVSVATPLFFESDPVHVLNMSLFTDQDVDAVSASLSPALLRLRQTIEARISQARVSQAHQRAS